MQQVNVYLNKLIKIDELIRLSNQSIQRYTRDRKSKEQQFLFLKARNKLFIWSLKEKKEKKVIFWFLRNGIWKKKRTDWRNGWISLNILENQAFQRTAKIIEMNDIVILAEVDEMYNILKSFLATGYWSRHDGGNCKTVKHIMTDVYITLHYLCYSLYYLMLL